MRRATLLAVSVALILALTAGVAVARTIIGGDGPNKIFGSNQDDFIQGRLGNDTIRALAGNDDVYGNEGNDELYGNDQADKIFGGVGSDKIFGGFGDDPALRGGTGNDAINGQLGSDRLTGDQGDDTITAAGDTRQDFVNCGEDPDGTDIDTAFVNGQDTVDTQQASLITTTTVLSCERLFVDGVRIPQVDTTP